MVFVLLLTSYSRISVQDENKNVTRQVVRLFLVVHGLNVGKVVEEGEILLSQTVLGIDEVLSNGLKAPTLSIVLQGKLVDWLVRIFP